MSLSGIKPVTAISGSTGFCRKIMQKHQTGRKNTSRFPTMIFFKKRGYLFSQKISDRIEKWKKMAVSYPYLVYYITSSNSRVFENQINFFLSFHLQKQNVKFFNALLNHLNLALIQLRTRLYQLKTERTTKNFKKTFLLSITGSKNVSVDKINNTNNITGFLQNINKVSETAYIPEKTCFLKSLLPESRFLRPTSDSRISWIESTVINKGERTANEIENLNLLFTLKFSQNPSNVKVNGYLKNWKLLERTSLWKKLVLLSRVSIIRSNDALQVIEALSGRKSSKDQYLLNNAGNLNNSIFSIGIDYLSNSSFLSTMYQLRDTLFSKASSRIYSQNFTEKLLRMDFSADKKTPELKMVSSGHYSAQKLDLLEVNRIINSILLFTIKLHGSLPDQMESRLIQSQKGSRLLDSKNFLKKPHYLNDSVFLSDERFLKSTIFLKTLNSAAIMNYFYRIYFLNNFFNQDNTSNSSLFSTGIYHHNNPNFLNRVLQLRYTLFSKASRRIHSQNRTDKPLRMDFSANKKMIELKVTGNKRNFAHGSKFLKVQKLENDHPGFERMTAFSSHVVDLYLNNLTLSERKMQFSTLINQTPVIAKKNLIFSLSRLELRNKRVVPIFKKKIMFFASGNEIPGPEYSKNHNFQKNDESLIFRTQFNMERKIEEKIEQKVRKNIEQIKKVSTEAIETIVQQSRSDYSGIKEHQKQYLDINSISDQVFRLMEHRLIIERERRGIL